MRVVTRATPTFVTSVVRFPSPCLSFLFSSWLMMVASTRILEASSVGAPLKRRSLFVVRGAEIFIFMAQPTWKKKKRTETNEREIQMPWKRNTKRKSYPTRIWQQLIFEAVTAYRIHLLEDDKNARAQRVYIFAFTISLRNKEKHKPARRIDISATHTHIYRYTRECQRNWSRNTRQNGLVISH